MRHIAKTKLQVRRKREMGLSSFVCIAFVLLVAGAPLSNAWGLDGHYMVCKIAQSHLTSSASSAVLNLLPSSANGNLASQCSWADNVRNAYPWSSPLHYVDTPDNLCTYDYTRDCHDSNGNSGRCVVGAINNYTTQLLSYPTSTYNLTEALLFLAHFMGDVHQPLHVGFTSDAGGNGINVYWYGVRTNLHTVWDTKIVQRVMSNYYGNNHDTMADSINANITPDQINQWDTCGSTTADCANTFATGSVQDACNYAYKDAPQNARLGDTYFLPRKPVVEREIAEGGIRLAYFLNQIFGP